MQKMLYRCKECNFIGEVGGGDLYIHCKNCGSIHVNTFYKEKTTIEQDIKEIKKIVNDIKKIIMKTNYYRGN